MNRVSGQVYSWLQTPVGGITRDVVANVHKHVATRMTLEQDLLRVMSRKVGGVSHELGGDVIRRNVT